MKKKFIGYKGIFIHRNKAWRWQIRFQGKIRTLTIGNIKEFSEKEVKQIVDGINIKEIKNDYELKTKIQELIYFFKTSAKKESEIKNDFFNQNDNFSEDRNCPINQNSFKNKIIVAPNKIFHIKKETKEIIYCTNLLPIKKGICSILSGKGGIGKSFLIIQEALQYLYENPNDKAFLWLSEDSENDIKERAVYILFNILKIRNVRDVVSILNRFFFYGASIIPINFFDKSSIGSIHKISDSFNQMLEELKLYDFIVLDPFSSFFNGDENSNTEVNIFVKKISQYSASFRKIFFILHHHGKGGKIRGAAAFRDGVRLHYSVLKKENNFILVEIEKDNVNMQKVFGKQKKIKIFSEELDSHELEKYNSFLRELEIMFNSDVDKIEESKLIQSIKAIEKENNSGEVVSQNDYIHFFSRNRENKDIFKKTLKKQNNQKKNNNVKNPFNEKIDIQIEKIMS